MKKLLIVAVLALVWVGKSEAAGPTRGAKASSVVNYSTTVSSVAIPGPVVVYSVIQSTGATGDYLALFDTNTVTGVTAALQGSTLKTRCYSGSSSSNTQCNFDPPLQFNNGLAVIASTSASQSLVVYERGRVTQGY